jgi:S1-C subfamily serine protease
VIVGVEPGGPAEQGGLYLGDVIVSIGGTPVASVEELQDSLAGDLVGSPVAVKVLRGGAAKEINVTVGERA